MKLITFLFVCFLPFPALCIVKYDEGRIQVNGVQLLQDSENPNAYYYIPPYPRISTLNNGDFEFFCIKYVGTRGLEDSGGLLHALVQFSLLSEELDSLQIALREIFPKAVIMGPVPMLEDGPEGSPTGFRIVSSILREDGGGIFNTRIITSGHAPLLPGSKAAIAAQLSPDAATLLWESFAGSTSDISVVVHGYFQALVKGYRAKVTADLELVYDHFSSFANKQSGFSRRQTQEVIDSLAQEGVIDIDIADMSDAYDIDSKEHKDLLNIITEKIIDLMFNTRTGWAKMPASESAIRPDEIKERYSRGAFVSFFVGDGTQPYIPDDQLLLKTKTEIRNFHFTLNLTQSTTIRVPVYAAGNIGGFYDVFRNDQRYFRVVDMNDPSFQTRDVFFQMDGNLVDSFEEVLDHVTVRVRKQYQNPDHNAFASTLIFNKEALAQGKFIQSASYKRLGDQSDSWLNYEYQVAWKLLGIDSVFVQPDSAWIKDSKASVSLQPPFEKREVEIDMDRAGFEELGYQSVRIRFASILGGRPFKGKTIVLRRSDQSEGIRTNVYHDHDQAIVYQVSWFGSGQKSQEQMEVLEEDYLFLIPPPARD